MTVLLTETAYAKINLALHVRKKREDGYHELETLFAFVDTGDALQAELGIHDEVLTRGEFAGALADTVDNIVAKALASLPHGQGWRIALDKRLPVAAGLGGGSADAGAVFRLVDRSYGLPQDWQARASRLGADVPACVASQTCIGRGTGTDLEPLENDLAGQPVLLVNPRIPLATGPVFSRWDGTDRGALPVGTVRDIALCGRNDLEEPAIALVPQIAEVLSALRETAPMLARMSGSGATCFALYDTRDQRDEAARAVARRWPDWWMMQGALR